MENLIIFLLLYFNKCYGKTKKCYQMGSQKIISIKTWTERVQKHAALISPIADAFVKRRDLGLKHPVHDFLFTYYSFSPAKLKQWVPSFEENLEFREQMAEKYYWFGDYWFHISNNILSFNKESIAKNTLGLAKFIEELCSNISLRSPRFGCFGLHEWAMVYKLPQGNVRHSDYPLRLSPEALAKFVERQTICCTHYDAFRFFTKEAQPLNQFIPKLENRLEMEQGGCVHANMDLYKWSTKLWPWIGSDFILKAFFLALKGRELDMRASPYNLENDGYEPICIETTEGRRQYQQAQQMYAEESATLRKELQDFCKNFLKVAMS
jgi:hypothetical protein